MELHLERAEHKTRLRAEAAAHAAEKAAAAAATREAAGGHNARGQCGGCGGCGVGFCGGCVWCGGGAVKPVKGVRVPVGFKTMNNSVRATWAYQTYGPGFKKVRGCACGCACGCQ